MHFYKHSLCLVASIIELVYQPAYLFCVYQNQRQLLLFFEFVEFTPHYWGIKYFIAFLSASQQTSWLFSLFCLHFDHIHWIIWAILTICFDFWISSLLHRQHLLQCEITKCFFVCNMRASQKITEKTENKQQGEVCSKLFCLRYKLICYVYVFFWQQTRICQHYSWSPTTNSS